MIKSMTGFGRYELQEKDYKISLEIKSVNHRYCDLSIKMLKKFNFMESDIRTRLKEYAVRGKVDVYLNYEDYTEGNTQLKYNKDMAASYVQGMKQLSVDFGVEHDLNTYRLAKFPEVFTLESVEIDEEKLYTRVMQAVEGAGKRFLESRIAEGERLKEDVLAKLDGLLVYISFIEERSPQIMEEHKQKLMDKVTELLGDKQIDESVLATEMIVYADKICVDEETVRLRSHIQNMKDTLAESESIGRKLDFITQEMNREANTILSKANDMDISNQAIELKTEIEKIREQIQNIE